MISDFETVTLVGGPLDGKKKLVAKESKFFLFRTNPPDVAHEGDEVILEPASNWITYRRGQGSKFYCDPA